MKDDQLKQLLQKYSVAHSLPEGSAHAAMRFKRTGLQKLLRKYGRLSFFAFLTSVLFFAAKKAGLSISLLKINLFTVGIIVGSAVVVTSGAAYVTLNESAGLSRDSISRDHVPPFPRLRNESVPVPAPKIVVIPFRHDAESASVARMLERMLQEEIERDLGARNSMSSQTSSCAALGPVRVSGSVISSNQGFAVVVRAANAEAEVVFYEKYTAHAEQDISSLVHTISHAILTAENVK